MLQEPGMTAYMGCIGDDDFGKKLQDACKADGVQAMYLVDKSVPTGKCAVTILDKERSLTTELSAANNYKASHLQEAAQTQVLEGAKVVYSAGFFITVSPESMDIASEKTVEKGTTYCLNLSAPFIVQVPPFRAQLEKLLPATDYLFGNETEAQAYAEAEGWEPTIVAIRGVVTRYPVIALPKEKLVDTNGAGDAFVGGFLAALVKGKDMESCCKAGAYSASVIIQHSGCTYPPKPEYSF